ncbi:bacillithiol system redox-active protein YtxJ [Chryseobacterium sp.]|uniref:bacillithiol system redox-active protein YtxJ n=1 Tax=Chryseobacterium sp. TaxID=1871047 RepID=UPI0025BA40F3|nr:bacillithiol system redox-active protein YtxJ [Chryseobacterium sp.]
MSFFDKIFGGNSGGSKHESFWKEIQSEEDLEKAIESSYIKRVALFKHSTSCFISKTVLRNFEREVEEYTDLDTDFYYLDLLAHRNISSKISDLFQIRHESPQLIVIENGKAVNNASHQHISISQVTTQ